MECIRALTDQAALKSVASLFQNWQETLIWSALEGIMGQVWVCADAEETAQVAACQTGDFLFLSGDAHSPQARRLLQGFTAKTDDSFFIAVPQNPAWSDLICSFFGDRARPGERYAIRKEGDVFDREHLQRLTGMIPDCVSIKPIRGQLYHQVMEEKWSRDFCSQFPSQEAFERDGLGFVALYGDEIIGGASSYTRYSRGIEIQVETRTDWRQVGIASACCARLILECLKRGLYPSWDAANRTSVALAKKLGYHEAGAYPVFYVNEKTKN